MNELDKEDGGIHLFDTEQVLTDYLGGPIVAEVKSHPALQDLSAKQFDVMGEVTAITRGPILAMAAGTSPVCAFFMEG